MFKYILLSRGITVRFFVQCFKTLILSYFNSCLFMKKNLKLESFKILAPFIKVDPKLIHI